LIFIEILENIKENSEIDPIMKNREEVKKEDELIPKKRKPIIAAILSSVTPGLGQVYNGQVIKGLFLFLATKLFIVLLSFTGLQFSFYGLIATIMLSLFFWLFIVLEAFFAAKKIKEISLKPYNKWSIYLLIVLVTFGIDYASTDLLLKNILGIQGYKLQTSSMQPSLQKGEYVMTNLKYYKSNTLQRGDLVVFKFPQEPSKDFLHRVVALEGEKIEIKNRQVYINNSPLQEDYKIYTRGRIGSQKMGSISGDAFKDNHGPVMVPWGTCFVLGDNRDNSYDSRHWDFLPLKNIKGKASYIYLSVDITRIGRNIK
jgi:signal peptidase I